MAALKAEVIQFNETVRGMFVQVMLLARVDQAEVDIAWIASEANVVE
jgi:hypothetical protein